VSEESVWLEISGWQTMSTPFGFVRVELAGAWIDVVQGALVVGGQFEEIVPATIGIDADEKIDKMTASNPVSLEKDPIMG
jgi:hypothetical protein